MSVLHSPLSSDFPVCMKHMWQAVEYQNLHSVLIHGFWFLWRLRWPSLIYENDFAVWWQGGCIFTWIPQQHCSTFFFPHCSLRCVQSADSIRKVKYPVSIRHGWRLVFVSLFTRLCCPQPLCHVIPEVVALLHIRAAVNHLGTPLFCHRSGRLLGSHVPYDVRLDQGPLLWRPPATRTKSWSQQSGIRTAGMDSALVLTAILHIWIIKSWQPQMKLTGYILFLINQSPGSEGAEKLFK